MSIRKLQEYMRLNSSNLSGYIWRRTSHLNLRPRHHTPVSLVLFSSTDAPICGKPWWHYRNHLWLAWTFGSVMDKWFWVWLETKVFKVSVCVLEQIHEFSVNLIRGIFFNELHYNTAVGVKLSIHSHDDCFLPLTPTPQLFLGRDQRNSKRSPVGSLTSHTTRNWKSPLTQ